MSAARGAATMSAASGVVRQSWKHHSAEHAENDMVNVRQTRCGHSRCNQASYGEEGSRSRKSCAQHDKQGMINLGKIRSDEAESSSSGHGKASSTTAGGSSAARACRPKAGKRPSSVLTGGSFLGQQYRNQQAGPSHCRRTSKYMLWLRHPQSLEQRQQGVECNLGGGLCRRAVVTGARWSRENRSEVRIPCKAEPSSGAEGGPRSGRGKELDASAGEEAPVLFKTDPAVKPAVAMTGRDQRKRKLPSS